MGLLNFICDFREFTQSVVLNAVSTFLKPGQGIERAIIPNFINCDKGIGVSACSIFNVVINNLIQTVLAFKVQHPLKLYVIGKFLVVVHSQAP